MSIEERVARLEGRAEALGAPITRHDLAETELAIRHDIAGLASGIGGDLRAMRSDLAEIRQLLARRRHWWQL